MQKHPHAICSENELKLKEDQTQWLESAETTSKGSTVLAKLVKTPDEDFEDKVEAWDEDADFQNYIQERDWQVVLFVAIHLIITVLLSADLVSYALPGVYIPALVLWPVLSAVVASLFLFDKRLRLQQRLSLFYWITLPVLVLHSYSLHQCGGVTEKKDDLPTPACRRIAEGVLPVSSVAALVLITVLMTGADGNWKHASLRITIILGSLTLAVVPHLNFYTQREKIELSLMLTVGSGFVLSTLSRSLRHESEMQQMCLREARNRQRLEDEKQTTKRFIAYIFHEIRVPLNVVALGLSMLSNDRQEPGTKCNCSTSQDQADAISAMVTASDSVTRILNDVLDLRKIEEGMLILQTAPFDLMELMQSVVWGVRGTFSAKGIDFNFQVDPWTLKLCKANSVVADAFRIQQVLHNLLSNAAKFTSPGGAVVLRVSCVSCSSSATLSSCTSAAKCNQGPHTSTSDCRDEQVQRRYTTDNGNRRQSHDGQRNDFRSEENGKMKIVITVEDNGIGITQEDQQRLFSPYVQVVRSRLHRGGGTGLGLALSLQLVQLSGGNLTVQSEPDCGSTFTLQLLCPTAPPRQTFHGTKNAHKPHDSHRQEHWVSLFNTASINTQKLTGAGARVSNVHPPRQLPSTRRGAAYSWAGTFTSATEAAAPKPAFPGIGHRAISRPHTLSASGAIQQRPESPSMGSHSSLSRRTSFAALTNAPKSITIPTPAAPVVTSGPCHEGPAAPLGSPAIVSVQQSSNQSSYVPRTNLVPSSRSEGTMPAAHEGLPSIHAAAAAAASCVIPAAASGVLSRRTAEAPVDISTQDIPFSRKRARSADEALAGLSGAAQPGTGEAQAKKLKGKSGPPGAEAGRVEGKQRRSEAKADDASSESANLTILTSDHMEAASKKHKCQIDIATEDELKNRLQMWNACKFSNMRHLSDPTGYIYSVRESSLVMDSSQQKPADLQQNFKLPALRPATTPQSFSSGLSTGGALPTLAEEPKSTREVTTTSPSRASVLVVDDCQLNRLVLSAILRKMNLKVSQAENGSVAVDMCRTYEYHAIIMDKEMPVMDGHMATQQLRQMGVTSLIIGLTGNALEEDRIAFFAHGIDEFLTKPVQLQEIAGIFEKYNIDCNVDWPKLPRSAMRW